MAEAQTILTGIVSGLGVTAPVVYLIRRLQRRGDTSERDLWARFDLPHVYERRRRRRNLGMAMMAVISIVFFVGANFVNPTPHPRAALAFWVLLLGMLAWLCVLAVMDLADVRKLQLRLVDFTQKMLTRELRNLHDSESQPPQEDDAG